jgi:hypothetical protein
MATFFERLKKEDQEKLRAIAKALGIENWKPPIEDTEEIGRIIRQPPKYKGKPGKRRDF